MPNPTRDNYTFVGWCVSTDESCVPTKGTYVVPSGQTGGIIFNAVWTPVKIQITYHYNDTEEGQTDWCNKFDTTDAGFISAWNSVKDKYDELFGSSSTWSDASAKEVALNMLQFAYPDGRADETKDVLQTAMARYDRIVARDSSLAKFVTRAKTFSSPVTNNPISKIVEMGDPIWVVTIASLLSVAAVAGFVIYKKRKETF